MDIFRCVGSQAPDIVPASPWDLMINSVDAEIAGFQYFIMSCALPEQDPILNESIFFMINPTITC